MKIKGSPKTHVEYVGGEWLIHIGTEPHYTVGTTVRILSSSQSVVNAMVELGELVGPESTPEFPVDHEALLKHVRLIGWRKRRAEIRRSVAIALQDILGGYDEQDSDWN
jgi:hypothetical protein